MESLRLTIDAQPARLAMQGQRETLDLRQPHAVLQISKTSGQIEMDSHHPQLNIDASVAHSEEGHKTTAELTQEFAADGSSSLAEFAQRLRSLRRVHVSQIRNKNAIANYEREKAVPNMKAFSLTFVPSSPPSMSFSDNDYRYAYQPSRLDMAWETYQSAEVSVAQPADLSIWMAQEPSLHFSVTA